MAPLTGIAFAINWLISKLNLNALSVKTTRMTTNCCGLHQSGISVCGTLNTAANKFLPSKNRPNVEYLQFSKRPFSIQ